MSSSNQRCFSIEELIAYREGSLAAERLPHLKECDLCKGALDGLALTDASIQQGLVEGSFLQEFNVAPEASTGIAKKRSLFPIRWLVAASVGLAIAWAAWQYHHTSSGFPAVESSPLASVEEPYRRQMRSAGITTDMYGQAAQAYAKDSFLTSIHLYQAAIPKAPTALLRTRGYYEIGITYWKAGAFEEAVDYLTRARLGELDYYEDATWALAQLYRQMGFLEEAQSLYVDLLKIKKSPYYPKAQQMIELIDASDSSSKD